eukprot:122942_1
MLNTRNSDVCPKSPRPLFFCAFFSPLFDRRTRRIDAVAKLRVDVAREKNGEEWCRRAGERSEEELRELRAKADEMERGLSKLRDESDGLQADMGEQSMELQRYIMERDDLRIQADMMKDEIPNMEMTR